MKKIVFLLLFPLLASCAKIPVSQVQNSSTKKLSVGSGPEDMVLDTFGSNPRLLVSCSERRINNSDYGEIFSLEIASGKSQILPRKNEPPDLIFRPHGIDLVTNPQGEVLLYCISHDEKRNKHPIITYGVYTDSLVFEKKFDSPLLVSPNDLAASPSGEIFVTNDAGKRNSFCEALLKLKKGTVVKFDPQKNNWQIIAEKLLYANGIALTADDIIVSTVRQNALFTFGRRGFNKKIIAELSGLDNISFATAKHVLVTAHPSLFKFLRHLKNAGNKSPSVVYYVNMENGEVKTIFSDDGSQISASSTAIYFNGKLYISQVFDPYILEVDFEGNMNLFE